MAKTGGGGGGVCWYSLRSREGDAESVAPAPCHNVRSLTEAEDKEPTCVL